MTCLTHPRDALGHKLTEGRFAQTILAATTYAQLRKVDQYQVKITGKIEPTGGRGGSGSDSYDFIATISAGSPTRMTSFQHPYKETFPVFRDEKLDVSEQMNDRLASIREKTRELAMLKGMDISITDEESSFTVHPLD